jgi:fatty-acyl-CoA synthase
MTRAEAVSGPPHPHRALASTLPDLLDAAADRFSGDAVVFEGERIGFAELSTLAEQRARGLLGLGIGRGEKVGLLMANSIEQLALLFAIAKIGAVPVPINNRFSAPELAHVIADGELRLVIVANGSEPGRDYVALLGEAVPDAAASTTLIIAFGEDLPPGFSPVSELALAGAGIDVEDVRARQQRIGIFDTAMIIYTSGTTARPKGCVLNHEGLTRTAFTLARERFEMTETDRFWDPLPFCHLSSLVILNACIAAGAAFVSMERFEAASALALLANERCTMAYPCFEPVTAALLEHADFPSTDLATLRMLVTIGVPERLRAWQRQLGDSVAQISAYGATEYSGVLAFGRPSDPLEKRLRTCGTPIPGMEVRILDPETGEPLPDSSAGELQCRGYGVFQGYYRDPEATAQVMTADGWIRSGDLVIRDEQGYLAYHGRLKDMVKVGGENVAAAEIEDVLVQHPAVREVHVVAAPDARYTEVPAAFVELTAGAAGTGEDELIAFCVGRLAHFKIPRYVRIVDDWPMSGTKVQKVKLRERIAGELEQLGIREAPRIASLKSS